MSRRCRKLPFRRDCGRDWPRSRLPGLPRSKIPRHLGRAAARALFAKVAGRFAVRASRLHRRLPAHLDVGDIAASCTGGLRHGAQLRRSEARWLPFRIRPGRGVRRHRGLQIGCPVGHGREVPAPRALRRPSRSGSIRVRNAEEFQTVTIFQRIEHRLGSTRSSARPGRRYSDPYWPEQHGFVLFLHLGPERGAVVRDDAEPAARLSRRVFSVAFSTSRMRGRMPQGPKPATMENIDSSEASSRAFRMRNPTRQSPRVSKLEATISASMFLRLAVSRMLEKDTRGKDRGRNAGASNPRAACRPAR